MQHIFTAMSTTSPSNWKHIVPALSPIFMATKTDTPKCLYHENEEHPMIKTCLTRGYGVKADRNSRGSTSAVCLPDRLVRPVVSNSQILFARTSIPYKNTDSLSVEEIRTIGLSTMLAMKEERIVLQEFTVPKGNVSRPILLGAQCLQTTLPTSKELPSRIVLYPMPTTCSAPEHAQKNIAYPIPAESFRALCPFLPDFLPPVQKNTVAVIPIGLPAPGSFFDTFATILWGAKVDWIKLIVEMEFTWCDAYDSASVLGAELAWRNVQRQSRAEVIQRATKILRLAESILRMNLNYCRLGVWDPEVLDHMDKIYAGCLHALSLLGIPVKLEEFCSFRELMELMKRPRTLGELYADAIGCYSRTA